MPKNIEKEKIKTSNIKINFKNIEIKKENLVNNNNFCSTYDDKYYYENIYNYLLSFKMNTINNKTNWKKIIYPKDLYVQKDNKILKDKRKQNFRLKANKYKLIENNLYYIKKYNNEEILLKVPREL